VTTTPAIVVENLHFAYNDDAVFTGAHLAVHEGDFAGVVGPNGGGKTTLLKLLLGLLQPQQGVIRVLGQEPGAARQAIGYMPQSVDLDPAFPITVRDVVMTGCLSQHRWFGRYTAANRAAAIDALRDVKLAELADRSFANLSGGQRRRVLIARALVAKPRLLLLDEPTANLDPGVEQSFYEMLKRLNERLTVVVVSHDLSFVSEYVRSAICVNRNVVVHPTGELPPEMIGSLMGARQRIVRHDHIDSSTGDDEEGCCQ